LIGKSTSVNHIVKGELVIRVDFSDFRFAIGQTYHFEIVINANKPPKITLKEGGLGYHKPVSVEREAQVP
jgi:hypothetical protein